tara:strand:+ start:1080 stop:1241 length:162 start_codon:yes stop_codon:yes gene_type:complete
MAKTVEELIEDIVRDYDADLVVEILNINTQDLLDRFDDKLMIAIENGDFDDGY